MTNLRRLALDMKRDGRVLNGQRWQRHCDTRHGPTKGVGSPWTVVPSGLCGLLIDRQGNSLRGVRQGDENRGGND